MEFHEGQQSQRSEKATLAITPMPYSRLIVDIMCAAVCGWVLLDAVMAHASLISGGMQ